MSDQKPVSGDLPDRPRRVRRRLGWILLVGLGAYVVIVTGCQRAILFPRQMLPDVHDASAPANVQRLSRSINGAEVEAWFVPGDGVEDNHPGPLVIFAHGNGEVIDFWPSELGHYKQRGVSVLLVEFRGYGRSTGKPSEKAIVDDFIAFYDQAIALPQVDAARIIFHGRSVGGGVVAQLAAKRKPAGLILESVFTSVADMAKSYWIPSFLVRDPFEVRGVLRELDVPVLIIHGLADELIPPAQAVANHKAALQSRLVLYEHVGHNDPPPRDDYWQQIDRLLIDTGLLSTTDPPSTTMPADSRSTPPEPPPPTQGTSR